VLLHYLQRCSLPILGQHDTAQTQAPRGRTGQVRRAVSVYMHFSSHIATSLSYCIILPEILTLAKAGCLNKTNYTYTYPARPSPTRPRQDQGASAASCTHDLLDQPYLGKIILPITVERFQDLFGAQ